jgi:hypothetical protein
MRRRGPAACRGHRSAMPRPLIPLKPRPASRGARQAGAESRQPSCRRRNLPPPRVSQKLRSAFVPPTIPSVSQSNGWSGPEMKRGLPPSGTPSAASERERCHGDDDGLERLERGPSGTAAPTAPSFALGDRIAGRPVGEGDRRAVDPGHNGPAGLPQPILSSQIEPLQRLPCDGQAKLLVLAHSCLRSLPLAAPCRHGRSQLGECGQSARWRLLGS